MSSAWNTSPKTIKVAKVKDHVANKKSELAKIKNLVAETKTVLSNTKATMLTPKRQWPNWAQNCFKAIPLECNADYAILGPFLVFLSVTSCSQYVYLHVCQILNTHSLAFIRWNYSKLEKKLFFFVPKRYASALGPKKSIFWTRYGLKV